MNTSQEYTIQFVEKQLKEMKEFNGVMRLLLKEQVTP